MDRRALLALLLVVPLLSGHMCGRDSGDPIKGILGQKVWTLNQRAQTRVRFDPARPARVRLVVSGNARAFPSIGPQPSTGGLSVVFAARGDRLPDPAQVGITARATVAGVPRAAVTRVWPASGEHWVLLSVDWWRQEEGRCAAGPGCERTVEVEFVQTKGAPFEMDVLFKAYLFGPERRDGVTLDSGKPQLAVRVVGGGLRPE